MKDSAESLEDWKPLPDALNYPIRGDGKYLLAIGAGLSALLSFASGAIIIGGAAMIVGLAYFNAYYCNIVESTVSGNDDAPDWPDVSDFAGEILLPLLRTLGVWLLSFLPFLAVVMLRDDDRIWTSPPVWLAIVCGVFYFPMAILNVIVGNEIALALPQHVMPRIRSAFPEYLVLAGLLLAGVVVSVVVASLTAMVPFTGGLLGAGASLYFAMAQARLAGLFYRNHLEEAGEEDGDVEEI